MTNEPEHNVALLFPTTILSTQRDQFVDVLLPVCKNILSGLDPKQNDSPLRYKTTFSYSAKHGLEIVNEFKPFCEEIMKTGLQYANYLGYVVPEDKFHMYLFVSEMFAGDCISKHTHPNSMFSGVFYLQVPSGSSQIVFSDPRPVKNVLRYKTTQETITNMSSYYVEPKPGMLLMWESWLEHEAINSNNKDDGRISLVFNLVKKDC